MRKTIAIFLMTCCFAGNTLVLQAEEPSGATSAATVSEKDKFFQINWSMLSGSGTYNTNATDYTVDASGLMIEPFFGTRIPSLENMKFGIAPSFYFITGEKSFVVSKTLTPTTIQTQNWKVTAYSYGAQLLAKYVLGATFGNVSLDFSNGVGLGFYNDSVDGKWRDPEDPTQTDHKVSDSFTGIKPTADADLQIKFKVTNYSWLGANIGANLIIVSLDDFEMPAVIKYGVKYELQY